ncbi:membrane protein CcdC involved in cytochrome C biogenesis [Paenibacillus shirakamiensis]|uniref:Membrane protein CcdC involved in cytochrome C biogenesis n=1 Tax=Paenibacillus shirakamiensis TaxID=1265935 RepID=A0ABS4JIT5_9BACL|nr:cytochrome c biogenesis protein CcdC [Paenibacillus shirakamiensis]MBP2001606.1 membrane protein CcdC involved in cytochrome C biogenesis [Paenibacillus shirakamiensis]
MTQLSPSYLQIFATVGTLLMALLTIFIRLKASRRPVNIKKIIMPPVGMSTGFLMFLVPDVRIPWWWGIVAFAVGWFLFSYPLIRSTKFEVVDGQVYAQRSRSFIIVLLVLFAVRMILHQYIEMYVSVLQTGALFFMLAFGMILRWRLFMWREYKVLAEPAPTVQ